MSRRSKLADTPKSKGDETGAERADIATRIKPGQVLNPKGRPKGSRNQLGEDFISALQADFKQHGTEVIAEVRETKPSDYLKVVASILPKEINVNKTALQELSDDELAGILEAVRLQVLSGTFADAGDGGDPSKRH